MKRTTELSCKNLACSCCNTMRYEVSTLEQQNAKLESELRIYKNVASGIADERLASNELLDSEQKNAKLVEALKLADNIIQVSYCEILNMVKHGYEKEIVAEIELIRQTLAEVKNE